MLLNTRVRLQSEPPGTRALSAVCVASKTSQVVLGLRAVARPHASRSIAKQRAVASVEPSLESGHRLCSSYSHRRQRRGSSCRIRSWISRKPIEISTRGVSIIVPRFCARSEKADKRQEGRSGHSSSVRQVP